MIGVIFATFCATSLVWMIVIMTLAYSGQTKELAKLKEELKKEKEKDAVSEAENDA